MFNRILIANRGEIACRIIKACQKLEIESVAVYSHADRNSLFVESADLAYALGEGDATSTYLNIKKIIEVAKLSGAEAIHPGYGFLSENAAFAAAVKEAGLVFIGPKSTVIQLMGSKIAAKNKAEEVGVPVVPGYQSDDQSEESLYLAAQEIGFPLMIKASAGGGGRGMRLVQNLKELDLELAIAQQEAQAAFGDHSILLERYVETARHIEVQVLGDQHGNVVHLHERDCSLQRNNQKVIEEAPAPNLPTHIREAMYEAAVKLAQAVSYHNAGTIEFIYDCQKEDFYFLEMNTRLQVEHPVTEKVTGIDLVEWQIRVAAGERLTFQQSDISVSGWAIEARLAAENPAEEYLPQTGIIEHYREPIGEGVRVDSGVQKGSEVTHHFDSMLAKLIACGETRQAALRKLSRSLNEYEIGGVVTNLEFLQELVRSAPFEAGSHQTKTIVELFPKGWELAELDPAVSSLAALCFHISQKQTEAPEVWKNLGSWRLTDRIGVGGASYYYLKGKSGAATCYRIESVNNEFSIELNGVQVLEGSILKSAPNFLVVESDQNRKTLEFEAKDNFLQLRLRDKSFGFQFESMESHFLGQKEDVLAGGNQIIAPMPGLIIDVLATAGDQVEAGQTLVVLEAMKLMQKLTAPVSGTVDTVSIQQGDTPEKGKLLVSIKPVED
ncbi:acetyl-CoA carboxylase biotin carboxylase subunit [Sneathiella limimaris]|uniref:acetyl-CoA carboxylase biotin carboxylase subunit n=1 Tax=Sneathiella limimaris TaxID=1964213 RepID=UPI00146C96F5|nr:acetyl-CoA carboxylase biotin carboxylase subunit [Sneathiella limimaris]